MIRVKNILLSFILIGFAYTSFCQELDDYLSQPFPTILRTSADGNKVAWVFNTKGERNIFLASTPDFKAKRITNYKGDIGIEITEIIVTNTKLYFVRGNSANTRGEIANPALVTEDPSKTMFEYDLAKDSLRSLGLGSNLAISPNQTELAFIRSGQINIMNVTDRRGTLPRKVVTNRGTPTQLSWSPNGNAICFVSSRQFHSFIGLVDSRSLVVSYLNPGLDRDIYPTWNKDGSKLAYIRVPAMDKNILFNPKKEANPFSVHVFDIAAKSDKKIFTADEGPGSYFTQDVLVSEHVLHWSDDDKIFFPWEKTGWMHLYMTDEKGSKPIDLTPGDGEVEYVVNDHLSGNLLIVSNHGDRDLKRIHKLSKSARQLTTLDLGGKIEAFARPLSNGLAFIQSSSEMTPWPMVSVNGKIMPVATEQKSTTFPKDLRSPSSISITATDGQAVPIQLFLPKNYNPNKKYPATIFIHGGSRRQMLRGFNHGYYYHHAFALNQYFADKGYIVISLNFRSGIGYGLSFREADEYGPTGASEVRDLIGAGLYLKNRSDVDASSISLWGGSYGGYMTAHGLAQASSIFHCGVDIHGVHDWNDCIKLFNPWYDKHEMKEFSDKAIASSPLAFMDTWKSPVLLIHGDDDRNVSFEQSTKLAEQLQKRKIPYEQLILTDEIHSFLLYKSWLKVYESTYNFINKYTSKR